MPGSRVSASFGGRGETITLIRKSDLFACVLEAASSTVPLPDAPKVRTQRPAAEGFMVLVASSSVPEGAACNDAFLYALAGSSTVICEPSSMLTILPLSASVRQVAHGSVSEGADDKEDDAAEAASGEGGAELAPAGSLRPSSRPPAARAIPMITSISMMSVLRDMRDIYAACLRASEIPVNGLHEPVFHRCFIGVRYYWLKGRPFAHSSLVLPHSACVFQKRPTTAEARTVDDTLHISTAGSTELYAIS
jgi:hypothetical protein